jgi:hypothetical protein
MVGWELEHTGGGCWVLERTAGDGSYVMVTGVDGPLLEGDTVEGVESDGGWLVGWYTVEGDDYRYECAATLSDVVRLVVESDVLGGVR